MCAYIFIYKWLQLQCKEWIILKAGDYFSSFQNAAVKFSVGKSVGKTLDTVSKVLGGKLRGERNLTINLVAKFTWNW